ncbi:MAG: phage major capsid protein [Ignavibacteriae bacterium]|nr:MAG: phage major capsid protein [Ignavibacteriota bacterium]
MKADFSGYATKAGVKCTDGRTITPQAFKHQDQMRVPLVWQHGHSDPENVLGHAILEAREDGVYTYGFFNNTKKAEHARSLVEHDDITMLSIWANQLIERAGNVLHGAIREVSLVLSGANPGAVIEQVTLRHDDGEEFTLEDEVYIRSGESIQHGELEEETSDDEPSEEPSEEVVEESEEEPVTTESDETVQEVYESLNETQKEMVHSMLGAALENGVAHADDEDETVEDVYNSMTEKQKQVLHYMLGEALAANAAEHSDINNSTNQEGQEGTTMKHNVFEDKSEAATSVISHDDMKEIVANAKKTGSLKDAVEEYALAHGITDIDFLFPDAQNVSGTPEWLKRRTEWVADLLSGTRKSPFSRIKTIQADLTWDEARAKGYVTGNMKKEEFFGLQKRVTTPTTIYKKQALDRDDMIDITDFDVVAWLKDEMRMMLDEELARAILIGDGRDIASEDKINEQNIRPIASDSELYTTTINVNVADAQSSMTEVVDAVITNRYKYKGTGLPNFYTTEYWIGRFMTLRDGDGHRLYKSMQELALELRVGNIIPVEAMMEDPTTIGIIVNPVDYVLGADKGGAVTMFDDFDIDYNKQKYLIETRVSGALVKAKSAMVVKSVASTVTLVTPTAPTFNEQTGVLSITDTAGVVYKNGLTTVNASGSPYAAIAAGATITITAEPASASYAFPTSDDDTWVFTRES